jgi:hypothetical protein
LDQERAMPEQDGIVAVGFLTERDLRVLGQGFKRSYPIEDHHEFDYLLRRIDEAERGRE